MTRWVQRENTAKQNFSYKGTPLPKAISHILSARGLTSQQEVDSFLDPAHETLLPHNEFYDIKRGVEKILSAVKNNKKIVIHGDYDVDGVCATAILWDYLHHTLKADVIPFIPNRFDDGYGMNNETLKKFQTEGVHLIITVDCGVRDADLVKKWSKKGIEFIITDHHEFEADSEGNAKIPDAVVIHARHPENTFTFTDICGTATVWKLIQALVESTGKGNANKYSDLVALATTCDVMPLIHENRLLVRRGLCGINSDSPDNVGLRALLNEANITDSLDTYHLGFVLGPRINAAGRLESAMDALRLLSTKNKAFARELAQKLSRLNTQRQELTQQLLNEASAIIEKDQGDEHLLVVHGKDWPEGVLGLVAGKLVEQTNRPVIVSSTAQDGSVKGSARSIPGFSIIDAITLFAKHLDKYGGHNQAAGFSLSQENLGEFKKDIQKYAQDNISKDSLQKLLEYDLELSPAEITADFVDWINYLAPFGYKNPTPSFLIRNSEVTGIGFVGKDQSHVRFNAGSISAIGFNLAHRFGKIHEGDTIDLLGNLGWNEWNGHKKIQLSIKDIKTSS